MFALDAKIHLFAKNTKHFLQKCRKIAFFLRVSQQCISDLDKNIRISLKKSVDFCVYHNFALFLQKN